MMETWRFKAATAAQTEKLRYFGYACAPDLTRGDASDLIDQCVVRSPELEQAWQDAPASDRQLQELKKLGCIDEAELTHSEAKDLIDDLKLDALENETEAQAQGRIFNPPAQSPAATVPSNSRKAGKWTLFIVAAFLGTSILGWLLKNEMLPGFLAIVLLVAWYFLPSAIAHNKRNAQAIFLLNFFLGWTFIGWVVALVWAAMRDREKTQN
jgi:hypothetical protein